MTLKVITQPVTGLTVSVLGYSASGGGRREGMRTHFVPKKSRRQRAREPQRETPKRTPEGTPEEFIQNLFETQKETQKETQ